MSQERHESSSGRMEILLWIVYLALLCVAAVGNLNRFNHDAVAYLQLADHWAHGRWSLAVSGYWSPLLSWLAVPWRLCSIDPFVVGRLLMVGSGVLWLAGMLRLVNVLNLSIGMRRAIVFLSALMGIGASVEHVTPDLLVAGILMFLMRAVVEDDFMTCKKRPIQVGCLIGLGFLAKAIALPWGLGLLFLSWVLRPEARRRLRAWFAWRPLLVSTLVVGAFAGPWIAVLSIQYNKLTVSTTGAIAHSLYSADGRSRPHPYGVTLGLPSEGRVTSWEDPSEMDYPYWSPFESAEGFQRQMRLVIKNAITTGQLLRRYDPFCLSIVGMMVLSWVVWQRLRKGDPWATHTTLVGGVLWLMGLYIWVYLDARELRYYYPIFVGLMAIAGQGVERLCVFMVGESKRRMISRLVTIALILSFGLGVSARAIMGLRGSDDPAVLVAKDMEARCRRAEVVGIFGGSGLLRGKRSGLFLAWLLEKPWAGDTALARPAEFAKAGVTIAVLNRQSGSAAAFEASGEWENLDGRLFEVQEDPRQYPIQLFRYVVPNL